MSTQLVRYEAARTALAEAHRVDEVKDIRDKAEAMAAYARQAKDQELILWATEIKVRAERKAGELLAQVPRQQSSGRPPANSIDRQTDYQKALADSGLTQSAAYQYERLAAMPEDHFETAVAMAKDTAGQVTTAFMLREAGKARPHKKLTKADESRLAQLDEAKGASMLVGYARMVLRAMRERDSLSEQERTVLGTLKAEIERALAH